jgi:hypothetical protein
MSYNFDLGIWSRKISTRSDSAQLWFDRGLNWTYAYNHEEAVACFQSALEEDAECAMAWWGIAYACGPFYNRPCSADLAGAPFRLIPFLSNRYVSDRLQVTCSLSPGLAIGRPSMRVIRV